MPLVRSESIPEDEHYQSNESSDLTDAEPASSYDDEDRKEQRRENIFDTPQKNAVKGVSLTSSANRSLAEKCDLPLHCLLTLEKEPQRAIQICHFIPKAIDRSLIRALEYCWGFKRGHLNVNSHRNVAYLRSDLHIAFDAGDWALVPQPEVLNSIQQKWSQFAHAVAEGKPLIQLYAQFSKPSRHKYTFLPLRMSNMSIFRRQWPAAQEDVFTSTSNVAPQYLTYNPPYSDFPVIESHVHPLCVIFNTAPKIAASGRLLLLPAPLQTLANLMVLLHAQWNAAQEPPSSRPDDPSDDGPLTGQGGHPAGPRRNPPRDKKRKHGGDAHGDAGGGPAGFNVGFSSTKRQVTHAPTTNTPELDANTNSPTSTCIADEGGDISFKHHDLDPRGWAIEVADVAAGGEFDLSVVNDDQIGRYHEERVRKPRKKSWHTWRADWLDTCPPDTSRFSSNDWAYWRDLVYLTD